MHWISTGSDEIDTLIAKNNEYDGEGGFPKERITEVFAAKGVGKTRLLSQTLPKMGGNILYVDVENGLSVGVPDNVLVVKEDILEVVWGLVNDALDSKEFDAIVVDSVAAMTTLKEQEKDEGEVGFGDKAKLMNSWMRRIQPHIQGSGTALIFVNQQRDSLDQYGPKKYTPGGRAVEYAASIRIELKSLSADKIMKSKASKIQLGRRINVILEKNRFGAENQTTSYNIIY